MSQCFARIGVVEIGAKLVGLQLGNFKAISSQQNIPLRPITLLFGPNSAGKSTIIHSLAFAHEAARTNDLNVLQTQIGGTSIDLGGFSRFVFHRDASKRVQWGAEIVIDEIPSQFVSVLEAGAVFHILLTLGIPVDDVGLPIEGSTVSVESYELSVNSKQLLRMSRRPDVGLRLDQFLTQHPLIESIFQKIFNFASAEQRVHQDSDQSIADIASNLAYSLGAIDGHILPLGFEEWGAPQGLDHQPDFQSISAAEKHIEVRAELTVILSRLQKLVYDSFNEAIKDLRYLGPLRSYPSRTFAFEFERDPDWRAGGGFAWDEVRKNKKVREEVNRWLAAEWLQTRYRLSTRRLIGLLDIKPDLEDLIENVSGFTLDFNLDLDAEEYARRFLEAISLDSNIEQIDELVLTDIGTDTVVSHRDVGIGISQVLPVLVSAFAERESLIAIEQPEIHLHPALQSELGDIFITSALGESKNRFILETHSEHVMLRLLRRIRESTQGTLPSNIPHIQPSDVCVLYVSPSSNGTVIQQIEITEDGDFSGPWPRGFFGERAKELF